MKKLILISILLLTACNSKVDWKVGSCYNYRTSNPFSQEDDHPYKLVEVRDDYGAFVICSHSKGCSTNHTISGKGYDTTMNLSAWSRDYFETKCPEAIK